MSGDQELARRAVDLAGRLPEELAPLAGIAYNYRWCWFAGGKDVFRCIDEERWELCGLNPVRLLQEVSGEALARAAGDRGLLARVASLKDAFAADLSRPPVGAVARERPIAFFCAEYGVHRSLPVYSGGLGALAGDLLKEASDRALPLVAVGLMYRQGYFRQRLDASGWQHEYWTDVDPERLPASRCFASRTPGMSQSTSCTCTSMTSGSPRGWCAAPPRTRRARAANSHSDRCRPLAIRGGWAPDRASVAPSARRNPAPVRVREVGARRARSGAAGGVALADGVAAPSREPKAPSARRSLSASPSSSRRARFGWRDRGLGYIATKPLHYRPTDPTDFIG